MLNRPKTDQEILDTWYKGVTPISAMGTDDRIFRVRCKACGAVVDMPFRVLCISKSCGCHKSKRKPDQNVQMFLGVKIDVVRFSGGSMGRGFK